MDGIYKIRRSPVVVVVVVVAWEYLGWFLDHRSEGRLLLALVLVMEKMVTFSTS
jgi:hypothetical protein